MTKFLNPKDEEDWSKERIQKEDKELEYILRTKNSRKLYERAKRVIPAGVTREFRFFEPYPFYVAKASGSRIYDVDGNEYLDFWMGHAALVLGHMHPVVVKAVQEQLELGFHFGFCHELEVMLAEQIVKMIPSIEMVRFTNSGTEANMHAIRLARAYTGRVKVAKFEGAHHGIYDPLDAAVTPPFEEPECAGLPKEIMKHTVVLRYNNLEGVEKELKKEELACVVMEPVLAGMIPVDIEFLKGVRELCTETGTILIFDEVITGFRMAPGGGQQYYGVLPDITTLGKALSGGEFPVGAFGGRREIMELMDHLKRGPKSKSVRQGGTFSGNPLVMRAGYLALKEYEKGEVYQHINRLGDKLRKGLEELIQKYDVEASVTGVGSMIKLHFLRKKPKEARDMIDPRNQYLNKRFFRHLLFNNVLTMRPENPRFFLSLAHNDYDIQKVLMLTEQFFKREVKR